MNSPAADYYTAERYRALVEKTKNRMLRRYMRAEARFLAKAGGKGKVFIDLGAGYGRLEKLLSRNAKQVIAIDINEDELSELRNRAARLGNVLVIKGDVTKLSAALKEIPDDAIFLIAQNTLGTIKGGHMKVLRELKKVSKGQHGIILSLFRQPALEEQGIGMYTSLKTMVGKPDFSKTDFKKGVFVTKNGYKSKWWTDKEIKQIKAYFGGCVVSEVIDPAFWIVYLLPEN